AREACDAAVRAMQLHHAPAARLLVQAVDVLGDHAEQRTRTLGLRQRRVARVGPGRRDRRERLLLVLPIAPTRLRARQELLYRDRLVAAPQPARAAEVRHARRHADPGAGERDDRAAAREQPAAGIEA